MRSILPVFFLAVFTLSCSTEKSTVSPRFNHVMLYVSDIEKSIEFYTAAFDLEVTNRLKKLEVVQQDGSATEAEVNMAFLKFPGQNFVFEMSETAGLSGPVNGSSYQHLGIDVADIESALKRAIDAGGTLLVPTRTVRSEGVEAKNAFFRGPDGELVELMEIISGSF